MVDEEGSEVFFDVQSFGFDYSEVFGGSGGDGGLDFAVSYEDLPFELSNGQDLHSSEEDEEAWYDQCLKFLDLNWRKLLLYAFLQS